jgi:hypothetical protein
MSDSIRPVRLSTFGDKAWTPLQTFGFAAQTWICAVSGEELTSVVMAFPLAFTTGSDATLAALMGLGGRNVFVGPDGRWLGAYVPAILRVHPFKLLPAEDGQFALGFDTDSGQLVPAGEGEPFFDGDGKPTQAISTVLKHLVQIRNGAGIIARATQLLHELGLLEPWPLVIRNGEIEIPVSGLQRINEGAMARLDDQAFLRLRQNGSLAVAYAQLFSMTNISHLGRLTRLHAEHAQQVEKQSEELKSMFVPNHPEDEIDWDAMLKDDES